jgi:hypothetical protein
MTWGCNSLYLPEPILGRHRHHFKNQKPYVFDAMDIHQFTAFAAMTSAAVGNGTDAHKTLDLCGCTGPFNRRGQGARLGSGLKKLWVSFVYGPPLL